MVLRLLDLSSPVLPASQGPCPSWMSVALPCLVLRGPVLPGSQWSCPSWISVSLPCLVLRGPALPGSQWSCPSISAALPCLDLRPWSPELGERKFLCVEPPSVWSFVTAAPGLSWLSAAPTLLGGRFGDTYSGVLALLSPLSPPTVLPELPGTPPGSHPWVAQPRWESAAGDVAEVTNILSANACLWELARALQTDESRRAVVSPDPSRRHNLAPPGGSPCSRDCDQQTCSLCGRLFTSAPS